MIYFYLSVFFMAVPTLAYSAGLVPCDGNSADPCQTCHVVELIQNVFDWLAIILGILFILIIVIIGLRLVSSVGDADAKTQSKRIISTAIVGYIIFLAVWVVVDLGLKMMVTNEAYSFWDNIQCVEQPQPQQPPQQS